MKSVSSLSKLPLGGAGGFLWLSALIIGAILGAFGITWLNSLFDFIASVYTRLFQFVAVPTIALAVITTLASLGGEKNTGKIFLRTITFTLLTTFAAALVGLVLYLIIAPENLPSDSIAAANTLSPSGESEGGYTFYDHILSVIPNNIITPFASGNVLSILIVSAAIGLALAHIIKKEKQSTSQPTSQPDGNTSPSGEAGRGALVLGFILALQDILYTLIHALIWALPLGIVAFAAQLSAQVSAGIIVGSLGKYVAVILGGNCIQFFIILPLFLLSRGLNPIKVLKAMSPAVLMALFTKSSAATLPVTMRSAEENLKVRPEVARFVLPICTTINMNGCAAFILVTSLFVMQNGGLIDLSNLSTLTSNLSTLTTLILWLFIAVISAVGNAGVPMGCYFLTLSLMSGIGAPISIMGIILPIFTIIDMIETAENVWSDSCVCAIVNKSTE